MFDFQPHLIGATLDLSPARSEDFAALFAVAGDPLIWALHPVTDRYLEPQFRRNFDDAFADQGALVVRLRASGQVIGMSRYSAQFVQPGEIEIGWTFLACAYWGGTLNRELKGLMLTHAFGLVDTVMFKVGEYNLRSRRALEKIGARLTDRHMAVMVGDVTSRHVFYAITPDDCAALLARQP